MQKKLKLLSVKSGEVTKEILQNCAELYCKIWQEPPWNENFWKAEEVAKDILNEVQKPGGDCFIAILEDAREAKVVGFTWGYLSSAEYLQQISGSPFFVQESFPKGNAFYVDELGVDSNCRGFGIGKNLSIALIENAKQHKADLLVLRTDEKALAARTLYAKLGFSELEVRDASHPGRTYWLLLL